MPTARVVVRAPSSTRTASVQVPAAPVATNQRGQCTSSLTRIACVLLNSWRACQVELVGQYSVERMLCFHAYTRTVRPKRIVYMFFATIAPCLVAIMVLESLPLAPIELGIQASRNFWIRTFFGTCMVTYSLVAQYGANVAGLSISSRQLIFISVATSIILLPFLYWLNSVFGFPMPFFVAVSMVPWSPVVFGLTGFLVRHQLRGNPHVFTNLRKYTTIFHSQSLLIIVYPAFSYIFNTYPSKQTALALLLPVIKLLFKNWFGYASLHLEDVKPELVVFNVEIFSALYVSACMQSASSIDTTVVIMVVDFIQAWLSIKDLTDVLDDKDLRLALGGQGKCHLLVPLAMHLLETNPALVENSSIRVKSCAPGKNAMATGVRRIVKPFIQTAVSPQTAHTASQTSRQTTPTVNGVASVSQPPVVGSARSKAAPLARSMLSGTTLVSLFAQHRIATPSSYPVVAAAASATAAIATPSSSSHRHDHEIVRLTAQLSDENQLLIVRKTLQILHIAEFVALIEYAEVFVPIVYSLFCVIVNTFPNGHFYTMTTGLTTTQFLKTLLNVLLYGSLELVSYVALDVVMRRKFNVSAFTQTAFVLETQWSMVQAKLTLWMLVVLQFSLQHYGADFSFQFKWLHRDAN